MRAAAHGPRRGRGPLLLAAAVAAAVWLLLQYGGSQSNFPEISEQFQAAAALATSPWPKVAASGACSAPSGLRDRIGTGAVGSSSQLPPPAAATAALPAAAVVAAACRCSPHNPPLSPLGPPPPRRTSAIWRCCGRCPPRPWACCLWPTAAATQAPTSGRRRGAAGAARGCRRSGWCGWRPWPGATPWWLCPPLTGRRSAGTTRRRTSRGMCR